MTGTKGKFAIFGASLLLATSASAVDVRGSVRSSEEVKSKAIEAVRTPYWQEWNGFLDPKKPHLDYAREVSAALIGSVTTRDATDVVLRDGTLTPSTIVIQHGTPLRLRNEDDFGHELYAEGLKGFGAMATSPGQTRTVQMEQTGSFALRDALSPHVRGHLHVIAKLTQVVNPNAEGNFSFKDVPPGKYTLKLFRGAREVNASELEVEGSREIVLDAIALDARPGK